MNDTRRIQLAVNYSPETEALKLEGTVAPDLYKLPDWPDLVTQVAAASPCYVHFSLVAGMSEPFAPDWPLIDALRTQTGTAKVNLHLEAPHDLDRSSPRQVAAVLAKAEADVYQVVRRYGGEQVVLENVPISGEKDYFKLPIVRPEAIRQVVEGSGCGLLLDLAHARLAASELGMAEREYISALPVECLGELHITGVNAHEGVLVDHMPMEPADWDLLDWALEQIRLGKWKKPEIAAFEYGGLGAPFRWRSKRSVLARQLPELQKRMF